MKRVMTRVDGGARGKFKMSSIFFVLPPEQAEYGRILGQNAYFPGMRYRATGVGGGGGGVCCMCIAL